MIKKYLPKLTEAQRKEICMLYHTTEMSQKELAEKYKVSQQAVAKCVKKFSDEFLGS